MNQDCEIRCSLAVALVAAAVFLLFSGCSGSQESADKGDSDSDVQVFHTYKLKNGKIRQFYDFIPTASYMTSDCHYVGVKEEDCDTIALVKDEDGNFLQSSFSISSLFKRIEDNGRTLYIAAKDLNCYFFYKLDCESLKVTLLTNEAVEIKAASSGFIVTKMRVSNYESATCNSDFDYLFYDVVLDKNGCVLKNDSLQEYDFDEFCRRYNTDELCPLIGFF